MQSIAADSGGVHSDDFGMVIEAAESDDEPEIKCQRQQYFESDSGI